ncbi:MAG: phenylacetate--CoA ligase family protein [Candidatus Sumerlaeaceae bacterium]
MNEFPINWGHRRVWSGYINRFLREGRLFTRLLAEMEERARWSETELSTWQDARLREILVEAARHVPYYRRLFAQLGLVPERKHPREILAAIPLLDKETVRGCPEQFLNERVPRWRLRRAYTSGTTGTPLVCYRDMYAINFEHAMIWRQWRWAGYKLGERRVTLRGELIVPTSQLEPPYWLYSPAENQLLMSSYHISPATLPQYVEMITKFQPAAIEGYPSSVYLIARGFEQMGMAPYPVKGVFTSSETVLAHQKETIERVFQCRVFDLYGNTERTAALGSCEYGTYHEFPDYAVVEYVPLGDGEFEVVGTPLFNRAFILLRYRSGDAVKLSARERCGCGRNFRIIEGVQGRKESYVWTPEGRAIGRLDHIFKGVRHVVESQIVQESLDFVRVLVVPDHAFCDADAELIIRNARERLGPSIQIEMECVEKISRTGRGKFVAVISKVSESEAFASQDHRKP